MKCGALGWACERIHQVALPATATQVLCCAGEKEIFRNSDHNTKKANHVSISFRTERNAGAMWMKCRITER
jgi:hypothetical protein